MITRDSSWISLRGKQQALIRFRFHFNKKSKLLILDVCQKISFTCSIPLYFIGKQTACWTWKFATDMKTIFIKTSFRALINSEFYKNGFCHLRLY